MNQEMVRVSGVMCAGGKSSSAGIRQLAWMIVLRGYLLVAGGLVLLRILQLATSHG
jgi:hypothetical protein